MVTSTVSAPPALALWSLPPTSTPAAAAAQDTDNDSTTLSPAALQALQQAPVTSAGDPLDPGPDGWRTIHQGGLNDCYFLSPLRSLAKNHPEAVRSLMHPNADGTTTVSFHGLPPVTVTGDEIQAPWAAQSSDPNNKWLNVMEAAWEKSQNKLGFFDAGMGLKYPRELGGKPEDAIAALTGKQPIDINTHDASGQPNPTLDPRLVAGLQSGDVITADHDDETQPMGALESDGTLNKHSYSVLDMDPQGNVLVMNPMGQDPPQAAPTVTHPNTPSGGRWMTPAEFNSSFTQVQLAQGSGPAQPGQ